MIAISTAFSRDQGGQKVKINGIYTKNQRGILKVGMQFHTRGFLKTTKKQTKTKSALGRGVVEEGKKS